MYASKNILSGFPALALALATLCRAQKFATLQPENHPRVSTYKCTAPGQCTPLNTTITLDANWRWIRKFDSVVNCYSGNQWEPTICNDPVACAENCALEGAEYNSYGVITSGNALKLRFVTYGSFSQNVASRVFLMASDTKYQMFSLLNQEFTFDVDVSKLPCGLSGALYFTGMDEDGGMSRYSTNKAGAKYGTGYCDSKCPRDLRFINGEANVIDWTPDDFDPFGGKGKYGSCCDEIDIWEANSISTAYTAHPCTNDGQVRCEGAACSAGSGGQNTSSGLCDHDGCDFNSYRLGNTSFYGPSKIVDTTKNFTVVTQFISTDGTENGDLAEIRRMYLQDGKLIHNSKIEVPGFALDEANSLTNDICTAAKSAFGENNEFKTKGGMSKIGAALKKGMVLALAIRTDPSGANMLWLDSDYPLHKDPTEPGVSRGTCPQDSGVPWEMAIRYPRSEVTFSNIKFGALDSTYTIS